MEQYGDLIEEVDDTQIVQGTNPSKSTNQNIGQITELVGACEGVDVNQLLAIADNDDEINDFMQQMQQQKLFEDPEEQDKMFKDLTADQITMDNQ